MIWDPTAAAFRTEGLSALATAHSTCSQHHISLVTCVTRTTARTALTTSNCCAVLRRRPVSAFILSPPPPHHHHQHNSTSTAHGLLQAAAAGRSWRQPATAAGGRSWPARRLAGLLWRRGERWSCWLCLCQCKPRYCQQDSKDSRGGWQQHNGAAAHGLHSRCRRARQRAGAQLGEHATVWPAAGLLFFLSGRRRPVSVHGLFHRAPNPTLITQQVCAVLHAGLLLCDERVCLPQGLAQPGGAHAAARAAALQRRLHRQHRADSLCSPHNAQLRAVAAVLHAASGRAAVLSDLVLPWRHLERQVYVVHVWVGSRLLLQQLQRHDSGQVAAAR